MGETAQLVLPPIKRPLDQVMVHWVSSITIDQYRELLQSLTGSAMSPDRTRTKADASGAWMADGYFNSCGLSIERVGRRKPGSSKVGLLTTLLQDWFEKRPPRDQVKVPGEIERVTRVLGLLGEWSSTTTATCHVTFELAADEVRWLLELPLPIPSLSPPLDPRWKAIRGLHIANADDSESAIIDTVRHDRYRAYITFDMQAAVGIGIAQVAGKRASEILNTLVRPFDK